MQIGDPVQVRDPQLAQLQAMLQGFGFNPSPNNLGWIEEFLPDGDILVRFPIGDDDPDLHSQSAPYPPDMVQPKQWDKKEIQP